VLSDLSALQGTREAILAAYAVRSDFEQALALDPGDASAHHLLGAWALRVALLGPWTRWLAGTLYAETPSDTPEEDVEPYEGAEALQPGFWVANRAQLARARLELCGLWRASGRANRGPANGRARVGCEPTEGTACGRRARPPAYKAPRDAGGAPADPHEHAHRAKL
jgi:hypothetical protein